jgi:hypothetical protein
MLVTTLVSDTKWAHIQYVEEHLSVVLKFKVSYVPIEVFKSVLGEIETFASKEKVSKVVFDKTNLTVFHQPSMEWYHVEWKERMLKKGVKSHRKILPQDRLFVESVRIGREKIQKNNPGFSFAKYDIQYCNSVAEALKR